jgi:hypothetical protein
LEVVEGGVEADDIEGSFEVVLVVVCDGGELKGVALAVEGS